MTFLSKEQQKFLEDKGWDLIDNKDGAIWAGWDWDSKEHPLRTIGRQTDIEDSRGYDFLIIGKKKVK